VALDMLPLPSLFFPFWLRNFLAPCPNNPVPALIGSLACSRVRGAAQPPFHRFFQLPHSLLVRFSPCTLPYLCQAFQAINITISVRPFHRGSPASYFPPFFFSFSPLAGTLLHYRFPFDPSFRLLSHFPVVTCSEIMHIE